MSTRTAQDTFLSDQALATGRDLAATGNTVPVTITAADGKQRCTWCDCPDGPDSPHNRPGYVCAGCPTTARYVVSTFSGPNIRYDFAACDRHHLDIVESIVRVVGGPR